MVMQYYTIYGRPMLQIPYIFDTLSAKSEHLISVNLEITQKLHNTIN